MKKFTVNKTAVLLLFLGIFLMQDKLQEWFQPFQYFDEAFGLLLFPLLALRVLQKRNPITVNRRTILFFVCLGIFWLGGWAGHFRYQYQPLTNALKDSFVNLKFSWRRRRRS